MKIAINGFGRIGRTFLRALFQNKEALKKISVAVINVGPENPSLVAHIFKYDSLSGIFPGEVSFRDKKLIIDNYSIEVISESDPSKIDWGSREIDWVLESSGKFVNRKDAEKHLISGAKRVLITAPAIDEDVTIIPGVNDNIYNPAKDKIVSLGSCTTNALAPLLKVLNDVFKVEQCFLSAIHAYTNSQVLLDGFHKDFRRARAAALNIIPTTTGAVKVIGKVMPELNGLIEGDAIRVPVANVSFVNLVVRTKKDLSIKLVNKAFEDASISSELVGILDVSYKPLVSSDYYGNNYSVIVDALLTQASGTMGRIFGWYDNEWGYSCRLIDFLIKNGF